MQAGTDEFCFESMAEGPVGIDGADRKTVPHHIGTADREMGPSSLYRGCSGRSGAELPLWVGWAERDEVNQVRWPLDSDDGDRACVAASENCDFESDALR